MKTQYLICSACGVLAVFAILGALVRTYGVTADTPAGVKPKTGVSNARQEYRFDSVGSVRPTTSEKDYTQETKMLAECIAVVVYLACIILMLAWVARDCRDRGVDGGAVWVLLVLATSVIGLLVYMASRPHGILVPCESCGNRKLMHAKICPHCGHSAVDNGLYVDLNFRTESNQ